MIVNHIGFDYPKKIPSSNFASNYLGLDFLLFKIKHLQPKTQKYEMLGFLPLSVLYGVFSRTDLMITLFNIWHAVLITSAQKYLGRLISFIIVLTNSSNTRFLHSTTSFCYGFLDMRNCEKYHFLCKSFKNDGSRIPHHDHYGE